MTKNQEPRTKNQEPRIDEAVLGRVPSGSFSVLGSPFDEMAANYDRTFTNSLIGTLMRQAVWRRLDSCFNPGDRVL
ncbi:MAG TPA: hypothetical protein VF909_20880, partial [Roseiflexaceae bacterium]